MVTLVGAGRQNHYNYNFTQTVDPREALWVDSVFSRLTEEERIGQLIVIRAHSDQDTAYENDLENLILTYKLGGLCFFQGTPERQAILTNRYQALSDRLPLMIAMDAEWGLGMRLKDAAISYPKQLMLGAIRDNGLIYEMGQEVGRQCRRLGVHVNFAPVADVNNNPANPVINDRSFGEDRNNVAAKCFQYVMGLQDGGVLACAKHFPGHGDTEVDSHRDLPIILHPRQRLDSLELFPFRVLAQYDAGAVMVAHLNVPALDGRTNRPTTLSRYAVTDLLRNRIGFDGLIFTDAMEMQGVAKYFAPGIADVEALLAGNDIVLMPADVVATVAAIRTALTDGTLDRRQFEASVRRMLRAKYRLGLTRPQRIELANLREDLNRPEGYLLKRKLIANALTLVRDRPGVVGFRDLEKFRFATLALGDTGRTAFQTTCGFYAPMDHFNAGKEMDSLETLPLYDSLRHYDVVLVSLHGMRDRAKDDFGLTESQRQLIERLSQSTTTVLTVFGNPYSLKYFDHTPVVLQAFNDEPLTQEVAAQALFGASDMSGMLPVTASPAARFGQGLQRHYEQPRLGYTLPEAVAMNSDTLRLMDGVVEELIAAGAAPGCQLLVAKDNQVIWHKAYGFPSYEKTSPVTLDNIYDLASVTKVAATTVAMMRLVGEGRIDLTAPMSQYIPELRQTNKKDLRVEEMLAHHAGLQPWIPFYLPTLVGLNRPSPQLYRPMEEPGFAVPVTERLFMADDYVDVIWKQIFNSELRDNKEYKYSDLGLYLGMRAVQNVSHRPLHEYVQETFYRPLGMATTTYLPWQRGLTGRCVPTEDDNYFRQGLIQGFVHDMGAAMLGGVSGHAGLFSNANDLAKLFQVLLNQGSYAGQQYLKPEVVRQFTTRWGSSTRRGLGFDMKELDRQLQRNMSPQAGANTFGHTGFTGICVWADPDEGLIFIFLSNRTFPSMNNNKLINGDYRPRLQSIVYRALQGERNPLTNP